MNEKPNLQTLTSVLVESSSDLLLEVSLGLETALLNTNKPALPLLNEERADSINGK